MCSLDEKHALLMEQLQELESLRLTGKAPLVFGPARRGLFGLQGSFYDTS
jgi:hypothetical protein